MNTRSILPAAILCGILTLPDHARAELYAYDGFDYVANTNEGVTLVGKDPSLHSAGSANLAGTTVGAVAANQGGLSNIFQSGGLTFGDLVVRGGRGRYKNSLGQAAYLAYNYSGPAAPAGSTLYTSHLIRLEMEKTVASVISLRFNTTKSSGSGTSFFVSFSDTSNTSSLVATQYGNTATTGSGSLALGPTYLVIGRFTNLGATTGTREATTYVLNEAQFTRYLSGGFGEAEWDAVTSFGTGADQLIGRAKQNYTGATAYNLLSNSGIQFGIGAAGSPGQDVSYDEMRCASSLVEVLPTVTPGPGPDPALVSLTVTDPIATEPTAASPATGRITLNRLDASTQQVTAYFAITGTATNGRDYTLPGSATLPANTNSAIIEIVPAADKLVEPDETVTLTLLSGSGYTVDPQKTATVTIQDGPLSTRTQLIDRLSAGIRQKVVVYGTSLTAGNLWPPQVKTALDAAYPGLTTLVNSGGSGMNSVWGVSNLNSKVIAEAPDTVFIEFAVNDAVTRTDYANVITPAQARTNLNSMINSIRTALPDCEIILQVMSPVIGSSATYRPNLVRCQQNYRDVAAERGFLCIDHMSAWQAVLDEGESVYSGYTGGGDGLHPTATGYSLFVTPVILRELSAPNNLASGTVMLHATNQRAAEPKTSAGSPRSTKLILTRGGSTAADLTVSLALAGTSSNGTDYPPIPAAVTIPAGSSSVSFSMAPSADSTVEGNETFTIGLVAGAGYTLASPNKASLVIEDRPFDKWRKDRFSASDLNDPAISGDNADPDKDGLHNLIEFYTNRAPKTADAATAILRGSETVGGQAYLTLTYDRVPDSGLTGTPQVSGDLMPDGWNGGPSHILETIINDTGLLQTVRARSLSPIGGNPKEFMRLKVTREP